MRMGKRGTILNLVFTLRLGCGYADIVFHSFTLRKALNPLRKPLL